MNIGNLLRGQVDSRMTNGSTIDQSSTFRPGTFSKFVVFLVSTVKFLDIAIEAIHKSIVPA